MPERVKRAFRPALAVALPLALAAAGFFLRKYWIS
jgi:hypothetical protein